MDQPLPGGPGIPIIAALSSKKPDVVLWLLENGGGKWGTLSDNAEEGVIQHALRYKSCNTLLERLMHHFELIWPEWITGEWSAVNAAICSGNMHGLRIVLNFIRNLSGRKSNGSMMAVPAVHDVLNLHHSFLPVHQAAEKNDVKALRILVDYGADINALDVADYSSALLQAVTNKAYSALRYLLKKGANPSISPRPEGWGTPFIEAIRANDRKSISILLPYMTRVDYSPVGPDSIVRYCRSPSTLASVLGGMFELPYSVYDKQTVIFRTMLRPGFQMYMLRSHLVTQFDIHDKAVPVVYMERLMPSITEMLHVLGKWTMQALFPTEPLDYDSPLCIAAAQGLIESCRTIISLDADLNFEGHALGSALLLACAKRQFKVVKLLVRAGAKITYFSTTSNEWKSAYAFAQNSPAILQWLLVGQYTEQRKISFAPGETHCSEERIRPWSGVTQVSLPLIGERKQRHEESLFDYVVRLHEIKRAFRGKVVYYSASGSC